MDSRTASGRRVDGVIQPVVPCVAGQQNDFQYYAYSAVANMLDVSSVAFPVSPGLSLAKLALEDASSRVPLNEEDDRVQANCKHSQYNLKDLCDTNAQMRRSASRRKEHASRASSLDA